MTEKKQMNWVIKNLLCGLVFILAISGAVWLFLHITTQHYTSVDVPDMVGMQLSDAEALAQKGKLELYVTDSVFVSSFAKGSVYAQNPKAGNKVKRGRKIYLTVNAKKEKQAEVPSLVGLSLRQAKVELTTRGLKLGRLRYVDDMATNLVLAQLYKGQEIAPGTSVDVGTVIDLKLGLNRADGFTTMPDFSRMEYRRALNYLQDNSFNLGKVVFDSSVKTAEDTLAAMVYRQSPAAGAEEIILGSSVTLYFTVDEKRLPALPEEPEIEE
ncbi:MAG: PASTA domain-containing protein [Bacteroidales bacterium]|nr:PASTA domain-containing protein [Bacteroidales bacterium]